MDVDVGLVPAQAAGWTDRVCIVIDELRASSTLTTLLDLGCSTLYVTRSLDDARRLGREQGALVAGERGGRTPRGFDCNNSPVELSRAPVSGRPVVLCTSNGTRILDLLADAPATLVGCLLNATACADAAVALAVREGVGIGIVCAGVLGRFALDDAFAAGIIADRIVDGIARRGDAVPPTDSLAAVRLLASAWPDPQSAMAATASGRLVAEIGAAEDVAFCARVDTTATVPILRPGTPKRIERLALTTERPAVDWGAATATR